MFGQQWMDIVIWVRGKLLLLACEFGLVQSPLISQLRLKCSSYTWKFLQHKSVIYCRIFLQPELKHFMYVGSTSQTLGDRERSRWGKYKQIRAGKSVCGELSLFWHHRRNNFHLAVPLMIMHVPQVDCLHTIEQTFINLLQPRLNAPWVRALVKAKHAHIANTDPVRCVRRFVTSWRTFRRFRRRNLRLTGLTPSVFRSTHVVQSIVYCYQILFDLASDGLKSFLAQKYLRSNRVDADVLYRLFRMATHLGDPFYETICRSRLNDVLQFRQLKCPGTCRPLSTPFLLPEAGFKRLIRGLLGDILHVSSDRLLPYHIPSTALVAASHPKIKDVLFSHKQILWQWNPSIDPCKAGVQCCCAEILLRHPNVTTVQGHIASSATLLSLPQELAELARSSCGNPVFMTASEHWQRFYDDVLQWINHHDLVRYPMKDIRLTWEKAWSLHTQHVGQHWTVDLVRELRKRTKGLVWHVRDHEGSHAHVFCPVKYWMMLQNTFTAASVFQPLSINPSAIMVQMEQAVPQRILEAFPFRFGNRHTRVSWAYILPKFKKEWKAGRPIVSFAAHPARQFLVVLARVTEMLVAEVCPHTRSYNDAIMLWQNIHGFFESRSQGLAGDHLEITMHNQDLSGFFVSIPTDRFMITFRILLCRFYDVDDEDLEAALKGVVVTVDLADNLSVMKTIRGRHCLLHDKKMAVPMDLFLEAVQVSFKFTLFVVGGQAIQQLRGAPMGSHFSPAACHAVVSLYEHMYFGRCLLDSVRLPTHGLVVRYVDNRLSLILARNAGSAEVQAFLHPDVYIPPIVLEYEEGNMFLGFQVDTQRLRVLYVQPTESWKFLHAKSAANTRTLLSSFRSRAHLIARASWPKEQREMDLDRLVQSYVRQGYEASTMIPILKHVKCRSDIFARSIAE